MIEKVNPAHPDKIADRIAGALVDYAYSVQSNPRIAVEALIGHRVCHIIAETSVHIPATFVQDTVTRIAGEGVVMDYCEVDQDAHLAANQAEGLRCGDNGIFKGMPLTEEQKTLSAIARHIFEKYPSDGKYILDSDRLIICQSNATTADLAAEARAIIKSGGAVYAAMLSGDAVTLSADSLPADFSVVIGNEGNGLPPEVAAACDRRVTIPMHGTIESLNAAMAAGIILWEVQRTAQDQNGGQ